MTTPSASPNLLASRGFDLILPAYKAAFTSVATVWPLLALGGFIVAGAAFVPDTIFDQQPVELGWGGNALWIGAIAVIIAVGLLIYANVWRICFTPDSTSDAPRSYFSAEVRAVVGTVFELAVRTLVIAIMPFLGLAAVVTLINFVTGAEITEIPLTSAIITALFVLMIEAIAARYVLAVPMAISAVKNGASEPEVLKVSWQRIKSRYPVALSALLPIAILSEIAYHLIDIGVGYVVDDQMPTKIVLVTYPLHYVVYVIAMPAALHVAVGLWTESEAAIIDDL